MLCGVKHINVQDLNDIFHHVSEYDNNDEYVLRPS